MIAKRDNTLLSVPDKMLTEIALGVDAPDTIAYRYGYDLVDYEHLAAQPSYQKALEARVTELEGKGEIFRVKARALADDLLEKVYLDAAKPEQDPKVRLDAIKFLAQAGGVAQPAGQKAQDDTPKFSITFKIGGQSAQLDFQRLFPESRGELISYDEEDGDHD